MKLISHYQTHYPKWKKQMDRVAIPASSVIESVTSILNEVKKRGDQALISYTKKFDHVTLKQLALTTKPTSPPAKISSALKRSQKNIEQFSKHRLPKNWQKKNKEGAIVGEIYFPFDRVGIYVPGGTAPLISTALMTITLAKTAGCREIVVTTPPPVNPTLHYAIQFSGATEIYQVGGAQAIAALAYGTTSVPKVQKIFGPGNAYVNEAKRQVVGYVAIDQLPGPSEILIIADETANPDLIAADLLAQAEHGPESAAILLTPSQKIRDAVHKAIQEQLQGLKRQMILQRSLESCAYLVQTRHLAEAVEIANTYAPEHLSLQIQSPKRWLNQIKTAGAIFVGSFSPVAAGDFVAGPSHTLPTGGAGKSFSGLTIDQFYRRTSLIEYSKTSLKKVVSTIEIFGEIENLDAHGKSARIRFS